MTEKFDSVFHRRYVDGSGVVIDKGVPYAPRNEILVDTYEELLAQYRKYVNDPKAEFTEEMLDELKKQGKI